MFWENAIKLVSAPRECVRNEVECTKEKHESDSKEKLKLYREDLLLRLLLKSKVNREEPRATGASVSECMEFYELLGPSKTFWLGEMVWREWEDKQRSLLVSPCHKTTNFFFAVFFLFFFFVRFVHFTVTHTLSLRQSTRIGFHS